MVDQYYKKPVNTSAIKQAHWRTTPLGKFGFEVSSKSEPTKEIQIRDEYKMEAKGNFKDRYKEIGCIYMNDKALSFRLNAEAVVKPTDSLVAFKNKFKTEAKHPDYNLFLDMKPQTK
jgi:hypothetical protein